MKRQEASTGTKLNHLLILNNAKTGKQYLGVMISLHGVMNAGHQKNQDSQHAGVLVNVKQLGILEQFQRLLDASVRFGIQKI